MKTLAKVLLCLAAFSPLSMNAQFCGDCCCEQYYVSVWGGGNAPFNNDPDLDTGWYVGGALGYRCSSNMRFDLSFDYLSNEIDQDSGESYESSSSNNDVNKYVVLANAYYDFCPWGCVVPYVGGGIGYAYIKTDEHHRRHHHFDKNAFAFQVGAGLTYEINECWSATASYRLLGTTNDGTGYHNLFGIGLTRQF
jgi:opacity protein-like surface antigen